MKEKLENGKVLNELIDRFMISKDVDDLEAIFLCLIDSSISVPIDSNMKKKDMKELEKITNKDDYTNKKPIVIKPDWLKASVEEKVLLPIFSNK